MKPFRLRNFQKQAIRALYQNEHVICVAATGAGKSLIYEEFLKETRCRGLLITPLVSLAMQQERKLKALAVPERRYKILSPEKLYSRGMFEKIRSWKPEFLVVDECHCIEQWGKSFRETYKKILTIAQELLPARSLWMTATLTPSFRSDLRRHLPTPIVEIGSFALPRTLKVRKLHVSHEFRLNTLLALTRDYKEAGVIFVPTRSDAQRLSSLLVQALPQRTVFCFHAGQSQEEKIAILAQLENEPTAVVVATSAFGMGVHFSQFRWAIQWGAPYSVVDLVQALGRAGRSQLPALGLVIWNEADFQLVKSKDPWTESQRLQVHKILKDKKPLHQSLHEFFGTH